MGTLASSDDPDEMPHSAALHPGQHCFRDAQSSATELHNYLEILT